MTRLTAFSLPGTGVAEMTTVSPRLDLNGAVIPVGHARQRRERLALAAGRQHADLLGRQIAHLVGVEDVLLGDVEVAELAGDLGVVDHRAASDDDLATACDRRVTDLLDAVDVARERGDDHALLGLREDRAQRAARPRPPSGCTPGVSAFVESLMSSRTP